ncbi:MAG: YhjD/YihY/BrkB family envelope integrity protein [Planctomycetota bacterium]
MGWIRRAIGGVLHFADGEGRRHRSVRYMLDLFGFGAKRLRRHRAAQMAAALTYRTLFSLIPLTVCALLVVNAFGGFDEAELDLKARVVNFLNLDVITDGAFAGLEERAAATQSTQPATMPDVGIAEVVDTGDDDAEETDEERAERVADELEAEARAELAARVEGLLSDLNQRIENVSFASISVVGAVLLVWSALSLLVTIEGCFNVVMGAEQGRRWALRVPIYWAVLSLGPVLLGAGFLMVERTLEWADSLPGAGVLRFFAAWMSPLSSLGITWVLLVLIYVLMPNGRLRLRSALAGGLVAAIAWEVSKGLFRLYVAKAVGTSALYGALGLIPLFMIWVYVTWIIVLFGLEVAHTLQTLPRERLQREMAERDEEVGGYDPVSRLEVAALVAKGFEAGKPVTGDELEEGLGLSGVRVQAVLEDLSAAGVVMKAEAADGVTARYTLGRPPDRIGVASLLERGELVGAGEVERPVVGLLRELDAARREWLEGRTLADVVRGEAVVVGESGDHPAGHVPAGKAGG